MAMCAWVLSAPTLSVPKECAARMLCESYLNNRKQDWQRSLQAFTPFLCFDVTRAAPQKPHFCGTGTGKAFSKSARVAAVELLLTLTSSSSFLLCLAPAGATLLPLPAPLAATFFGQSRAICPFSPQWRHRRANGQSAFT